MRMQRPPVNVKTQPTPAFLMNFSKNDTIIAD